CWDKSPDEGKCHAQAWSTVKKSASDFGGWEVNFRAAIEKGDLDAVKEIAKRYPKIVNAPVGVFGDVPIFRAIRRNNIELISLLLELGVDINGDLGGDGTPLDLAMRFEQYKVA